MTISQAVLLLAKLKEHHGDVEVLFDCGHCGKVTKPTIVVAEAVIRGSK